jgi:hypothetical protein
MTRRRQEGVGLEARMFRHALFAASALLALAATLRAEDPLRPPFLEAVRPENGERAEPESPFKDRIETDRDAFTPTVKTAGRGRLIVESAYSFIDNRRTADTHSFPEFLLRYGVSERLELRLGWNYEVGGSGNDISGAGRSDAFFRGPRLEEPGGAPVEGSELERDSRVTYGLKAGVTEQDGWLPESALILFGQTPTSGQVSTTTGGVVYVFGWEMPGEWRFDVGNRYYSAIEEEDRFYVWAPSAVVRVPLDERCTVHAEYFGLVSHQKAEPFRNHYVSFGGSYLVTPDLEVGMRGGWGLNEDAARGFINAGFGWRY